MKAAGWAASQGMRVLSPRMLPPPRWLLGSTASTASFSPFASTKWRPRASMNVLLPTPGTPVMPTRRLRAGVGHTLQVQYLLGQGLVGGQGTFDQRDGAAQHGAGAGHDAGNVFGGGKAGGRHTVGRASARRLRKAVAIPLSGAKFHHEMLGRRWHPFFCFATAGRSPRSCAYESLYF